MSQGPGVYLFLDQGNRVIYVGKAKNLKNRVSSYFQKNLGGKTALLVSQIAKVKTIKVESELESLLLEANLIQRHMPKYNVRFADDRAYPLIKITVKDKYPKVLVSRQKDNTKSVYFGPYPNVGAMRTVLKIARRLFPYQSVINHPKKLCFYNHLGLCPCPEITNDPFYKKDIKHLIDFFRGNTKKVLKDLEKERDDFSKNEFYEKARNDQGKIDSIKIITSSFYNPSQYGDNPTLKEDIRTKELNELIEILKQNGIYIEFPQRIECYDISIISGKYATGSMVVFTNGEKDSSQYRRFKIRGNFTKNNDFAMMQEIIKRRLNHNEWELPKLIIVDGGKGQISSALKVLKERKFNIPLVGLAKREEIIITPDFKEIRLPRDSKVLHLFMRIRDEAHRFAITYHRKIRSSFLFT